MNRILSRCLIVLLLVSMTLPVFAQRSLRMTLPKQRFLSRYGLQRTWWSQATLNPRRDTIRHFQADEDFVYVQSSAGLLTVFNAETGKKAWAIQLGFKDRPSFPVTSNQEFVLIASGMELFAFHKFTGAVAWKIRLPKHPSTSPTMDDKNVYIGALDGSVYAFSLKKINKLYDDRLLPQWSYQTMVWRYKTAKEVTTPPVTNGTLVAFASRDGSLYSVNASDRNQRFQLETEKPISAPMSQSGKFLYMASEDFILYCIDMRNGQSRWEFVSGYAVRKQPWLIGNDLFLTPIRGGLFTLSAETGRQRWRNSKVTDFLAATPSKVYASDSQGNVLILDRKKGGLVGALPLRGFSKRVSNNRTDRLFMATPSGLIIALREKQLEFPAYYKFPEHRPILPLITPKNFVPSQDDAEKNE